MAAPFPTVLLTVCHVMRYAALRATRVSELSRSLTDEFSFAAPRQVIRRPQIAGIVTLRADSLHDGVMRAISRSRAVFTVILLQVARYAVMVQLAGRRRR